MEFKLPLFILGIYLLLSLITFVAYWLDKSAAKKGTRRTPENTLHLLALMGGWPGALLARQTFRHKTLKVLFRYVLWLTVFLNIGAVIGLLAARYS